MLPPGPPPPVRHGARAGLHWSSLGAIGLLTVAAVALGQRDWAVPERVLTGWQVAAVPSSLTALLLGVTAAGLLLGTWLVLREAALRLRDRACAAWLLVSVLAAAALIWNALTLAADAGFETGAIIPVFHWLFTFVPAVLVGLVARGRGRGPALAAALATGAVTLPLFGLGWSLLASRDAAAAGFGNSLWNTAVLGAVPLVLAALIVKTYARGGEHSA